jgi:hypothetical protein
MAANRSSTVMGPAGIWTRVGTNAFVPLPAAEPLVLTTKLMFSASSGVSRRW